MDFRETTLRRVRKVVSERTGYTPHFYDLDFDVPQPWEDYDGTEKPRLKFRVFVNKCSIKRPDITGQDELDKTRLVFSKRDLGVHKDEDEKKVTTVDTSKEAKALQKMTEENRRAKILGTSPRKEADDVPEKGVFAQMNELDIATRRRISVKNPNSIAHYLKRTRMLNAAPYLAAATDHALEKYDNVLFNNEWSNMYTQYKTKRYNTTWEKLAKFPLKETAKDAERRARKVKKELQKEVSQRLGLDASIGELTHDEIDRQLRGEKADGKKKGGNKSSKNKENESPNANKENKGGSDTARSRANSNTSAKSIREMAKEMENSNKTPREERLKNAGKVLYTKEKPTIRVPPLDKRIPLGRDEDECGNPEEPHDAEIYSRDQLRKMGIVEPELVDKISS